MSAGTLQTSTLRSSISRNSNSGTSNSGSDPLSEQITALNLSAKEVKPYSLSLSSSRLPPIPCGGLLERKIDQPPSIQNSIATSRDLRTTHDLSPQKEGLSPVVTISKSEEGKVTRAQIDLKSEEKLLKLICDSNDQEKELLALTSYAVLDNNLLIQAIKAKVAETSVNVQEIAAYLQFILKWLEIFKESAFIQTCYESISALLVELPADLEPTATRINVELDKANAFTTKKCKSNIELTDLLANKEKKIKAIAAECFKTQSECILSFQPYELITRAWPDSVYLINQYIAHQKALTTKIANECKESNERLTHFLKLAKKSLKQFDFATPAIIYSALIEANVIEQAKKIDRSAHKKLVSYYENKPQMDALNSAYIKCKEKAKPFIPHIDSLRANITHFERGVNSYSSDAAPTFTLEKLQPIRATIQTLEASQKLLNESNRKK